MTAWSTGGGHCWRIFSSSCCWPALPAGMLPLGRACRHKALMLPSQQLHECSCYSMHGSSCSCIHSEAFQGVCVRYRPASCYQSVILSVRHLVQQFNSSPQLCSGPGSFASWAMEKGQSTSRTRYKPRPSFGKIQPFSGLVSSKVEGGKKGRERGKRNGSGWKQQGKLSRPFFP